MSGLPHAFETPPHGDAMLPNRTGGRMNVREALEKIAEDKFLMLDCSVLAPYIERALRAAAGEMADVLVAAPIPEVFDQCVTAGVAARMEKQ